MALAETFVRDIGGINCVVLKSGNALTNASSATCTCTCCDVVKVTYELTMHANVNCNMVTFDGSGNPTSDVTGGTSNLSTMAIANPTGSYYADFNGNINAENIGDPVVFLLPGIMGTTVPFSFRPPCADPYNGYRPDHYYQMTEYDGCFELYCALSVFQIDTGYRISITPGASGSIRFYQPRLYMIEAVAIVPCNLQSASVGTLTMDVPDLTTPVTFTLLTVTVPTSDPYEDQTIPNHDGLFGDNIPTIWGALTGTITVDPSVGCHDLTFFTDACSNTTMGCNSSCFQLGTSGSWTAPCDGVLYLYYNDARGTFGDNTGTITVDINGVCYAVPANVDPLSTSAVKIAVTGGTVYNYTATGTVSNGGLGYLNFTGDPNGRPNVGTATNNSCTNFAVNYGSLAGTFVYVDSSMLAGLASPITCPSPVPCGLYNLALVDNSSGGNFTGAASDSNNYSLSFTAQSVAVNSTTLTPLITDTYPNASSPMAGTSFSGVATNEGTGGTTPVTITPILFFDTGSGAWALVMEFTDPVTGFTGITTGFNGSGMMSPVGAYGGQGTVTTC